MAYYTIRIELSGSPSQNIYEDLHARMAKGGFLQTVTGVNASGETATADLPSGLYCGSSSKTPSTVRNWAKKEAKAAWGKSIVFVAQTKTWAWGKS